MSGVSSETNGVLPARLRGLTAGEEEQVWPLKDGANMIGRDLNCDVVLLSAPVSRRHARILGRGGKYLLTDLGSVNRTYLNGAAVEGAVELKHGDRIELGGLTLEFMQPPAETPAAPEPPEKLTLVMPEPLEMPSLVISGGVHQGVRFALKLDTVMIGRAGGGDWDIILTDRSVSRPHAKVERTGQGFLLSDLESANGTRVNGVKLAEPHLLKNGDVVLIGETILIFHRGAG